MSLWSDYKWELPDDDEFDGLDIECKFCGQAGLMWLEDKSGWKLHDSRTGVRHFCKQRKQDILNDFKE